MMIKDLILKSRSFRRFEEDYRVEEGVLRELIDCARLSPSAANRQPLKYILSFSPELNEKIFPHLAWAGYLKDWPGPAPGERPSAYIIVMGDTRISGNFYCDHGIAAQSMLLAAREKKLGGCIIASIRKDNLKKELKIPEYLEILLVIALGKPAEKVIIEPLPENGSVFYWRDSRGVHHVPKRHLYDIIISPDKPTL